MENITVENMTEAAGGVLLCGDRSTPLSHISIDSRKMKGADLFVPLIGEKFDAHRFIDQAMANGAAAALTSEHDAPPEGFLKVLIRVEDTSLALSRIGSYLRDRLTIPLVGITGSVGKTTTRELVAAALSAGFRVFKTPANYNSQVGVPITISEIGAGDEIGVLELGMSEPGEMTVISQIARVNTGLITNVGVTHIENLGSRERILEEKLKLQDGMREGSTLILNKDNDLLCRTQAREGLHTLYYGTGDGCDYRAEEIRMDHGKPSFTLVHGSIRVPVSLQMMGEHNVLNALAALAVADFYGVPLEAAAENLSRCGGYKNRQQIYESSGLTIIDDTYNASPDSMRAGLRVLASLDRNKRRIAVLADMKELGAEEGRFHYELGTFMADLPLDAVVTFGALAEEMAEGLSDALRGDRTVQLCSFKEEERQLLAEYLKKLLRPGDAVLFKGSNSMKLGEIAGHFTGKGQTQDE